MNRLTKALATAGAVITLSVLAMAVPTAANAAPGANVQQGRLISSAWCTTTTNQTMKSNGNEYAQIPRAGSAGSFDCVLEQGLSNNAVRALQNHLAYCYGKPIAVDGAFGPATYGALIQVQQSLGISADGVYGPQTRNAMRFKSSDMSCNRITAYNGF